MGYTSQSFDNGRTDRASLQRATRLIAIRLVRPSPSKGTLSRSFYNGRTDRASLQWAIRLNRSTTDAQTVRPYNRYSSLLIPKV